MKKTFTKRFIMANRGCFSRDAVKELSFINNKTITLKDMLLSELDAEDLGWFLEKAIQEKDQVKMLKPFANLACSEYEKRYRGSKVYRNAMEKALKDSDRYFATMYITDLRKQGNKVNQWINWVVRNYVYNAHKDSTNSIPNDIIADVLMIADSMTKPKKEAFLKKVHAIMMRVK